MSSVLRVLLDTCSTSTRGKYPPTFLSVLILVTFNAGRSNARPGDDSLGRGHPTVPCQGRDPNRAVRRGAPHAERVRRYDRGDSHSRLERADARWRRQGPADGPIRGQHAGIRPTRYPRGGPNLAPDDVGASRGHRLVRDDRCGVLRHPDLRRVERELRPARVAHRGPVRSDRVRDSRIPVLGNVREAVRDVSGTAGRHPRSTVTSKPTWCWVGEYARTR